LAGVLLKEDPKKNSIEINELDYKAKKAEQNYKKHADEWAMRAVRDADYEPLDQRSADKINKLKNSEKRRLARFENKTKTKGWSLDRIEIERQKEQEKMDLELADYFGLGRSHELER
jgi:hypothetical protein